MSDSTFEDELDSSPVTGDEEMDKLLQKNWSAIKTKRRAGKLLDILNVRLINNNGEESKNDQDNGDASVFNLLLLAWKRIRSRSKLNCSYGVVLQHKVTGEMRYYHSSSNNATLFEKPMTIATEDQVEDFFKEMSEIDLRERIIMRRPNTSWFIKLVTNITFYIYKHIGMGKFGCSSLDPLPKFLKNHKAVLNTTFGTTSSDNLCFFRCLAIKLQCSCPPNKCSCSTTKRYSTRLAKSLYLRFASFKNLPFSPKSFPGVSLDDLLDLEKLFDIKITVFVLYQDKTSMLSGLQSKSVAGNST